MTLYMPISDMLFKANRACFIFIKIPNLGKNYTCRIFTHF